MNKKVILPICLIMMVLSCHKEKSSTTYQNKNQEQELAEVKNLNTIPLKYPDSKKDTTVYDSYLKGKIRVKDPYQWLENDRSPETAVWVDQQNALTKKYLAQIPYLPYLKKRLEELLKYERLGLPYKRGDYYFITKNDGLQNQPVTYYKKGKKGKETTFLDPNTLSKEGTVSGRVESFSKNKKWVSIGINKAGSDWKSIKIKEVAENQYTDDIIDYVKFSGAAWYKKGFFYSRFPTTKESELSSKNLYHSVYYHALGTPQDQDVLVYKDNEPESYNNISVSKDEEYFILSTAKGTGGNSIRIAQATDKLGKIHWKEVIGNFKNENTIVGEKQGRFYLLTDYKAPNKRLVSFNFNDCTESGWKEVIPEEKSLLQNVSLAGGKIFANYLENAATKIYCFNKKGKEKKQIPLPGIGTARGFYGEDQDENLFYSFSSFTHPATIYEYNIASSKTKVYFQPKLKFNPEDYQTDQVWYKSKDGTPIPMFITYKKGMELNGDHPTYLYSYGGFNISVVPSFRISLIPFLEQGGIYASANLRGGGEYGAKWHEAGMLMKKQNVFDDFIAAAEYLIKEKYTRKEKLAIAGGSNGGLLVGACMVQCPDLYQVAFPAVGVMDMLKYHTFTIGWGWADEYGRSDDSPEMFRYLKSYSPLHNIKDGIHYPATLVSTADHDDRVVPAHSFKFIATLQEKNNGDYPELISIEKNAGHGAGKPITKWIDEAADKWSFLFFNMGYKELPYKP